MKSSAEKYSEAIAALTHRLNTWGVDDPETKAREFMHDLTCQGWRTIPLEVTPPRPGRPADEQVRAEALAAARAALRHTPERTPLAHLAAPTTTADDIEETP